MLQIHWPAKPSCYSRPDGYIPAISGRRCDFAVVRALRAEGYDVLAVSEFTHRSDDRQLIERAYREQRILLTEDKDFGRLVFVRHADSAGVILLRFPGNARQSLAETVRRLVREQGEQFPALSSLSSLATFVLGADLLSPRRITTDLLSPCLRVTPSPQAPAPTTAPAPARTTAPRRPPGCWQRSAVARPAPSESRRN